jgi:hypothetical protein
MFKNRKTESQPRRRDAKGSPSTDTAKPDSQPKPLELGDLTKVSGGGRAALPKGGW